MIGNISTHAALVSLWLSIWGDNFIVRKKKSYVMLRSDMNVWAGKEHTGYLSFYFRNGSNSVVYQIFQVTLGLEQKSIKISRSQSYRSYNEHVCPETASSGRKQASLKVFSWPPCSLTLCSSTVRFIGLLNCPGNLMCSEVSVTHLKSLQTVVGQDEAWFWVPFWNGSEPGFFSRNSSTWELVECWDKRWGEGDFLSDRGSWACVDCQRSWCC